MIFVEDFEYIVSTDVLVDITQCVTNIYDRILYHIYDLVLRLAVPGTPHVAAENIARDAVVKAFHGSTHRMLCYELTSVLVVSDTDIRLRAEEKAQLGIWLAARCWRVTRLKPPLSGEVGMPMNLPFSRSRLSCVRTESCTSPR